MECEQCGGTDFYKDAGFFYCSGCQIQSQEVQEYVFDEMDDHRAKTSSATRKVATQKSTDNKISSWECYNYILLGLTNELISLGADPYLKRVVKLLWLMYLEKMQVFKKGEETVPKLQAVSSALDADIVYGKVAKAIKKRKWTRSKSSSDETNATSRPMSLRSQRAVKKRALIKAHYDTFTQQSEATTSLHNETLTSLKSTSDKSSKSRPISYNTYATRELRRSQKARHLKKHRADFDHSLPCHKLTYRQLSQTYTKSVHVLSLNKLYAILYLGLLIIKSRIQLGDILRFMREGHLSFNNYSHFFPEDYGEKLLNFKNAKKHSEFANMGMRRVTSDMAAFLDIDWYVVCPNLVELTERFCQELNLPKEIADCVIKLISRTKIKMSFMSRGRAVPNYEGRVLSIILFVLKLLFGLDGVTEFEFSKYTQILNGRSKKAPQMFNIVKWLKHIEYRKIAMSQNHFPSSFFGVYDVKDADLAVSFLGTKKGYSEAKLDTNQDKFQQMLNKLKDHSPHPEFREYPVTFTPFLDYSKQMRKDKFCDILFDDFSTHSLAHVLYSHEFLGLVNDDQKPEVVNGGANKDWMVEKIIARMDREHKAKNKMNFVTVELSLDKANSSQINQTVEKTEVAAVSQNLREDFQLSNECMFEKYSKYISRHKSNLDFEVIRKRIVHQEYYSKHYNPYQMFWLRCNLELAQKDSEEFLEKFPYNFQVVFKECQRIAQQNEVEFFNEYQFTELYLCYKADFEARYTKDIKDKEIINYFKRCEHLW